MAVPIDFILRPAEESDAADLGYTCWGNRSLEQILEFLQRTRRLFLKGRGYPLVAEINYQAIGFGLLSRWGKIAEISDVVVAPSWQGQGIGTTIIQRLCKQAQEWTIPHLEIGAAESNPRALALYQRLGFVPDRSLPLDLGNGTEPVLYLVKILSVR
jgi:ribosomal protein S18 acetylase RimI-like enzyme